MSPSPLAGTPRVCHVSPPAPFQLPCWLGSPLITLFSPFCPRELDEEISADLADEVGATLDRLMLRLWHLGGGAWDVSVAGEGLARLG